jgi:hypothetical protein
MESFAFCPYQQSYPLYLFAVPGSSLCSAFSCLSLTDQQSPEEVDAAPLPPTLARKTSLKSKEIIESAAPRSPLRQDCLVPIVTLFYPAPLFVFQNLDMPSYISPSQQRIPKCKTLEHTRISDASWMKKGRLTEFCLHPEDSILELTDGFLNSSLGKKALEIAEIFCIHEERVITNIKNYLKSLSASHSNGTCLGQSYSMIIAYSKVQTTNAKKLFDVLNRAHVLFFQLVENFSFTKEPSDLHGTPPLIEAVHKKTMEVVEDASSWKYKGIKFLSLLKDSYSYIREIEDVLAKTEGLVEIGLFCFDGSQNHSILGFLTKEIAVYDSSLGMAHYHFREDLISDIQRLVKERILRSKLFAVSLTIFSKT